jgi:alpha-1,6-mannosyltransferase
LGSAGFKIVDITEFYSERGGGIRSHLANRSRFLAEGSHSHFIVAPGPRNEAAGFGAGAARAEAGSHLIRVAGPRLPYDRNYHLLHRIDKIRSWVRMHRPDVLEAHSPYLATAAVVACGRGSARLKTAFWHSDHIGVYVQPAAAKHLGGSAARSVVRTLWRAVRTILAPFDATFVAGRQQAAYLRAAGVPRVVHAPFGVDTRTFQPAARSIEWRRQWLGEAEDRAVLLVGLGRFAREKRWDVVLDAFGRLRKHRKATLVLFGDGPERSRLERCAPENVHFAGFEPSRDRLATALASSDVLVHASPSETFGLGIVEAVASGVPIVVPDKGGAAEHVGSACGVSYRSLDPESCAAAIAGLLGRPSEERRACALDAAARALTMEDHFRHVLRAYDDLLRELRR